MSAIRIFVSYSHRDREYLGTDSLLGFLRGLEEDAEVDFWTDEEIQTGAVWEDEIRAGLQSSHIALVLVSQGFLDSPYCTRVELTAFLERCKKEGLVVFPVILSPCEWERHEWLASRQFLPGGNETIEEHYSEPGRRKRFFLRIRKELRALVEQVRQDLAARDATASGEAPRPLAERRRVTVLHCEFQPAEADGDALDPEDLPEVLHELMPEFQRAVGRVIERFDGHLAQRLGSGLLVCFGYPTAREDASLRAVRAGLALVPAIAGLSERASRELDLRLDVRVGIHTGLIIGADSGDVVGHLGGEIPAVADDLQQRAPPDAVVISEATRRLVQAFFVTEELSRARRPDGWRDLRAFRVIGDSGDTTRFEAAVRKGLLPLVGRDGELAFLIDRWEEARQGRGQAVSITAENGLGKSRLVEELKTRLGAAAWTLDLQCSPYHQSSALFPIITGVSRWLGLDHCHDEAEKLSKLEQALQGFAVPPKTAVPVLASLLSIPLPPGTATPALTPGEEKEKTFEILTAMMVEQASRQPLLFVVEDLQSADASSLEFLELWIAEIPSLAVLVLLTFRSELAPPAWLHQSHISHISLQPLDPREIAELVSATTGGCPLPPEVLAEIVKKSEGVPLFVEDLTRMVLDSDLLEKRRNKYVLTRPFRPLAIPDTLQETLLVRLERLATARPVAQLGALLGREFSYEMLRAVAGLDDEILAQELSRLVSAGLLYRRGLHSRARYTFRHALIQEALLQSLLKRQRKALHGKIAGVLEEQFPEIRETQPELLAYHYTEAERSDKAIEHWLLAGERDLAHAAYREALRHAEEGLSALAALPAPAESQEREVLLEALKIPALLATEGCKSLALAACCDRVRQLCLESGGAPRQLFQAVRGSFSHNLMIGHVEESRILAEELLRMAELSGDEGFHVEARAALCHSAVWLGRPEDAVEHGEIALDLYDPGQHHLAHCRRYGEDPAARAATYSALSLWQLGYPERSRAVTRHALELLDAFSHVFSRAFVLCGAAWNDCQRRDAAGADEHLRALAELSHRHGLPVWAALRDLFGGWVLSTQGRHDEGIKLILEAMRRWQATGSQADTIFLSCLLAEAYQRAGRAQEGMAWMKIGFNAIAASNARYYLPELHRIKGELRHALGGPAYKVETCLERAASAAREQGTLSFELRAAISLARLWCGQGKRDQARDRLSGVYSRFTEGFDTVDLVEARALLTELAA